MMRLYLPDGSEQLLVRPDPDLAFFYKWLECKTIQVVNVLYVGKQAQLVFDEEGKLRDDPPPAINRKASEIWWTTARIAENASQALKRLQDHGHSYERKIMSEVLTAAVSSVAAANPRDLIVGRAMLLTDHDLMK